MTEVRYKRLTRTRARRSFGAAFVARCSLWLGPDHILSVETNGYAESYKRFHFQDIQAVIVRQTRGRMIWNAILTVPLVCCVAWLLVDLTQLSTDIAGWVCLILLGVFLLLFALNNLLGPTCRTQLRTAVQIEELPSLCRVKQTNRVLGRIRPMIAAAQAGEISPASSPAAGAAVPPPIRPELSSAQSVSTPPLIPPTPGLPTEGLQPNTDAAPASAPEAPG